MPHLSEQQIREIINGAARGVELKAALLHVETCFACQSKLPKLEKADFLKMISREPKVLDNQNSEWSYSQIQKTEQFSNWQSRILKFGFASIVLLLFAGLTVWFFKDVKRTQPLENLINVSNLSVVNDSSLIANSSDTELSNSATNLKNTTLVAIDNALSTDKDLRKSIHKPLESRKTVIESVPKENNELALNLDDFPKPLLGLASPKLQTRGDSEQKTSLSPKYPIAEVIKEVQPILRWSAINNVKSYQVSLYDENYNEIYSKEVKKTSLRIATPLKRGEKFQWQVKANLNDEKLTTITSSPSIFSVANKEVARKIARINEQNSLRWKKIEFLFNEGMLTEAEKTLQKILTKDRRNKAALKYLQKIKSLKIKSQNPPTETKPAQ
jgi:hypothetical protein